jgi:hypothetical protein
VPQQISTYSLFSIDYSLEDYKNCVQSGFNVGANIQGVYISASMQGGGCDGLLKEIGSELQF